MTTQQKYPPAPQLRVLADRIAAKVVPRTHVKDKPQARTDEQHIFAERLIATVLRVRDLDRRTTSGVAALRAAADAARRLQDAYSRMSKENRDWVEHIKRIQTQFSAGEIQDLETTIWNLSMLLHTALGKTTPTRKPPKYSRAYALYKEEGMFKPRVKDQILRELVFGLLSAAQDTRGKFVFNKNKASGNLAETLCVLRDGKYLPPNLVSNPLHPSTIQRLKDEYSRLTS
jgi:hypothetical protein